MTTTGAQTYNDDTVTLNGTYTTTNSAFTVDKATTLAGTTIVSTGTGNIDFKGTVNGAQSLNANSTGATTFGGVVGGGTPLTSLTTNAGGTTIVASSAITTVNDQVFEDAYVLKADTTLASKNNGRIAFFSTVDSYDTTYRALTVNTGGSSEFGNGGEDYVGKTQQLLSLTTNTGGTTQVWITPSSCAQPSIRTQGAQTYNDDVVIKDATVFHAGTGTITFQQKLSGNYAVKTSGLVDFLGAVDIGSFAQCDASTVDLNGGAFTTAGDQIFSGDVVLTANATQTSGGDIDFKKTVNGGYTLTLDATKDVYFRGKAGNAVALAGIALKAAASTTASDSVKLDGTTPRAGGTATPFADGLTIYGGVNKVSITATGTEVKNFAGSGIVFLGNSTQSTLSNIEITSNKQHGMVFNNGTYTGTTIRTNTIAFNAQDGISLAPAGGSITSLTIGGDKTTTTSQGNAIYGNGSDGIEADAGTYTGTVIQGNQIGSPAINYTVAAGGTQVTVAGDQRSFFAVGQAVALKSATTGGWEVRTVSAVALSGGNTAVTISSKIDDTTTSGTLVTGNLGNGINLNAAGGTISSLLIGGDATKFGNSIYANTQDGVFIGTGTYPGTTIGSFNEIGLNNENGIDLAASGATSLTIGGNFIGTLADGTTVRGNRLNGIEVNKGTYTGTTIQQNKVAFNLLNGISLNAAGGSLSKLLIGGDPRATLGNKIYRNGRLAERNGIAASVGDLAGTTIVGNTIRNNGNKTSRVGNGILVEGSNLMVGWTSDASKANTVANTITGNALHGIEIKGAAAQANTILSNSIYLNGYVDTSVAGVKTVVGDGIALTAGGNGGQMAPSILRVVDDATDGKLRVHVYVRAAGNYYVQLFDNTVADERSIFPADPNGFEGRTYVGDTPAQPGAAVTPSKPAIAGTLVAGNTLAIIEIDSSRVPAGNWITATATQVSGTTPGNTSPFSTAVQRMEAPVLAVAGEGPATWAREFAYTVINQNQIRVTGLSRGFAASLAALKNTSIVLTPGSAAAGSNVVRTVTTGQLQGTGVILNLSSGSLPAAGGTFVIGSATLPAARLYDASNPTAAPLADPGSVQIAAAIIAAGVPSTSANAFVNRFQGGLRVAHGDLDGDGYADLVTAPGTAPASMNATFGDAARVITIHNGNPAGTWQSASINVSSVFGATYTNGFLVTLGNVRSETAGSGNAVAELIVASTNLVAVFEVTVADRGLQPTISPAPAATQTLAERITGVTTGDFSAAVTDDIVIATTNGTGSLPSRAVARQPSFVQAYTFATGAFTLLNRFGITSVVANGPAPRGYSQNVFYNGASLAAGDIDGVVTMVGGHPTLAPELVIGASAMGMANFRVLANSLVVGGIQGDIDTALTLGNGFTREARSITSGWQPTGGPDYFVGMSTLKAPSALGANAPLSVAVVDTDGKNNARAEVFAALGSTNSTQNTVRRLQWNGTNAWIGAATLQGNGSITVAESPTKTKFPFGFGLGLG